VQLDSEYRPLEGWLFGILGVLVSGEAPIASVPAADVIPTGQPAQRGFVDINGSKLPGFQRLELKVVYGFALGRFPGQIALRLVNGYGLLDPITWEIRPSSDPRFAWRASLKEMKLFPLFPTVGVTFRF